MFTFFVCAMGTVLALLVHEVRIENRRLAAAKMEVLYVRR
jgi:hypothetical protein